ncbi:hypothetical protein FGO68_gene10118 [Halteria grandinella]|uniref:Serine carboxypeptidase n=1 Tax=Halteria grandinella TaxID=5974 RepID=A0A8J8NCZ3_HALGN|nr:hypothetical protein FGO68_gene10118 [Halteria grandinella]
MATTKLLAVLTILGTTLAARDKDLVTSLPNQANQIKQKFWSGSYEITTSKNIQYAFVESKSNPATDPLIVFLLGGPGVSSLSLGFFNGIGPLKADSMGNATFLDNPYSWNNKANVMVIDNPCGVGYSIGESGADYLHNDQSVAEDLYLTMARFYYDWPELRGNPLYLSGISYAGIYAPYLAYKIHIKNQEWKMNGVTSLMVNLKGFITGNGATDYEYEAPNSLIEDFVEFTLLPQSYLDGYIQNNCYFYWKNTRPDTNSTVCLDLYYKAMNLTKGAGIDTYDLMHPRYLPNKTEPHKLQYFLDKLSQGKADTVLSVDEYLSLPEVKTALHVNPLMKGPYSTVNNDIFKSYIVQREASNWIYDIFKQYGYKMMSISGDVDAEVTLRGVWKWIRERNWQVTKEWAPNIDEGEYRLVGYTQEWGNYTLATIHGYGHGAILEAGKDVTRLVEAFIKE